MTPYLDNIMRNDDDRVRRNNMLMYKFDNMDKFAPAEKSVPGLGQVSENATSRIDELRRQIADLDKQIASYDTEEAIGKYKFMFDSDPSVLTQKYSGERAAQNARDLQKASSEKADRQQLIDAWKTNTDNLDMQKLVVADKERRIKEALAKKDTKSARDLEAELRRELAIQNRYKRDNDTLYQKIAPMLFGDVKPGGNDVPVEVSSGFEDKIKNVEDFNRMNNDVRSAKASIESVLSNRAPIKDTDKVAMVNDARAKVKTLSDALDSSDMDQGDRKEYLDLINETSAKIDEFANPKKYGGKNTKRNPGDWKRDVDKKNADGSWMNAYQLSNKFDLAFILKAIQEGAENPEIYKAKTLAATKK